MYTPGICLKVDGGLSMYNGAGQDYNFFHGPTTRRITDTRR